MMPVTGHSVRERHSVPANSPRNLTGIFLGLPESHTATIHRSFNVPPLVKGRGQKFRVKTSSEERRTRMVELLRLKEEKRGFGGLPLRRKLIHSADPILSRDGSDTKSVRDLGSSIPSTARPGTIHGLRKQQLKEEYGFIRMNPRQYTAAINSGITHFEYLVGSTGHYNPSPLYRESAHLYQEEDLHEMLGMEACYRTVCKGNMESLNVLSPQSRRGRGYGDPAKEYTGFTVRSYRNPHMAELLPDFVQTVAYRGGSMSAPKLFSPHQSAIQSHSKLHDYHSTSARSKKPFQKHSPSPQFEDIILRISGTGTARTNPLGVTVSSLTEKKSAPALQTGKSEYADIRRAWNTSSLVNSLPEKTKIEEGTAGLRVVARSMPSESPSSVTARRKLVTQEKSPLANEEAQHIDQSENLNQKMEKVNCDSVIVKPTLATKKEDIPAPPPNSNQELSPKPPSAPIMISLDNEDGESKIVDIDAEDLIATGGSLAASREDLSDTQENKENVEDLSDDGQSGEIRALTKKSRSSEAIVASLKENAEQRQKDFEKLLDEHAVLVQEITRASSSDNLTQENTRE